jgi:phage repressor protein C with HTH and peptisase S24 domain
MKISEKLKLLREKHKLTQTGLADKIDTSQSIIGDIEVGRRTPSKEVAKRLANFFKVPIQVFLDEKFEINSESIQESTILVPYYNVAASAGEGLYFDNSFVSQYMKISDGEFRKYLHGIQNPAVISIKGSSMEPTLKDMDMIIVDTDDNELRDGEIYVVCIDNQIYIKRLFKNPTKKMITIKSDNPLFPPYDVSPDKMQINGHLVMRMFEILH